VGVRVRWKRVGMVRDDGEARCEAQAAQMFPCDACAMVRGGAGAVSHNRRDQGQTVGRLV
jgi:hypothetical protein